MPVTRFEELTVWKRSREFNREVYRLTQKRAFTRDFAMTTQLRRASLSVMNNIAEGFERYRRNEFMQFLSTSKGSAGEVRSMLYAAFDIGYIDTREFETMLAQAEELGRIIGSFRAGLDKSQPKAVTRKR
jgi:four helix bundle protein